MSMITESDVQASLRLIEERINESVKLRKDGQEHLGAKRGVEAHGLVKRCEKDIGWLANDPAIDPSLVKHYKNTLVALTERLLNEVFDLDLADFSETPDVIGEEESEDIKSWQVNYTIVVECPTIAEVPDLAEEYFHSNRVEPCAIFEI